MAPSDDVINAIPITLMVKETDQYTLNTVAFIESVEGRKILRRVKEQEPDTLVVGSIIAAQAFPGEVVAPIPAKSDRSWKRNGSFRLVRSDRFTVFNKED